MPRRVEFNYERINKFVLQQNGEVVINPALRQLSRLYVINNAATNRPVYIGTAANLQNRFQVRTEACRELGFDQNTLDEISIYNVQIKVDGVNRTPGNTGISDGIDVEHLLIRTYITEVQVNVRNIQKTAAFVNNLGQRLDWDLINNAAIPNFPNPNGFTLANGSQL